MPWPSKFKKAPETIKAPIDPPPPRALSDHEKRLVETNTLPLWAPLDTPIPGRPGSQTYENDLARKKKADQFLVETSYDEIPFSEYDILTNLDAPTTTNRITADHRYRSWQFTDGYLTTFAPSFKTACEQIVNAYAFGRYLHRGRVAQIQTRRHMERRGAPSSIEFTYYTYDLHRKEELGDDFRLGLHAIHERIWIQQELENQPIRYTVVQYTTKRAEYGDFSPGFEGDMPGLLLVKGR